jgi:hypothetical protein
MPEHDSSIRQVVTRLSNSIAERGRDLSALASVLGVISAIGLCLLYVRATGRDMTAPLATEQPPSIALASDQARADVLRARIACANRLVAEIEAVRDHGSDVIRIVDAVVTHLPNGTRLSEITFGDGSLSISGSADSAIAVAAFESKLKGMSGEFRDVVCSRNRTIGRAPSGRRRIEVERVIHAFDIRARYIGGRGSVELEPVSQANERLPSTSMLAAACVDAERRALATLESLPQAARPGEILVELDRLATRTGVHVERQAAVPLSEIAVAHAGDDERRVLAVQSVEVRVRASFETFRHLLGEIHRVAPLVGIDSLAISSMTSDRRFPLEGRLRIAVYHTRRLDSRGPISEEAK